MNNMKNSCLNFIKTIYRTASSAVKKTASFIRRRGLRNNLLRVGVCAMLTVATVVSVMCTGVIFAYSVSVNGTEIGNVSSRAEAEDAAGRFNSQIVDPENRDGITLEVTRVMTTREHVVGASDLYETIEDADTGYAEACGILVNSQLVAVEPNRSAAYDALNDIIDSVQTGDGVTDVSFFNNVEYVDGLYSDETVERLGSVAENTDTSVGAAVEYQWKNGDTYESIAEKFNVEKMQIEADNPGFDFTEGITLTVNCNLRAFAILTVSESTESTVVRNNKKSGTRTVTTAVSSVDGVEYRTETVSSEFETGVFPAEYAEVRMVGNYGFCYPIESGAGSYVSARWGDGRGHKGIDIACKKGTDIMAVSDGTVVAVNSEDSSYGNHVLIDHGNGIRTMYAHCSAVYVAVGQKVGRGQIIAAVGSTGRSTGNHLHFEVRLKGNKVNPAKYIGL